MGHKAGSVADAPHITYRQALAKYVVTPTCITTIGECSPDEMRALVNAWASTAEEPRACEAQLQDLDYSHGIDKWYAVDTCLHHQCCMKLFDSLGQAAGIPS